MRYIQRTYVNAVLDGESKNQFGLVSVLLMIPKAFQDDKIQDFLYRLQTVTCVCVTMKCGFSSLFHPLPLSPSPFFLNSSNINICHLTTATVLQKKTRKTSITKAYYMIEMCHGWNAFTSLNNVITFSFFISTLPPSCAHIFFQSIQLLPKLSRGNYPRKFREIISQHIRLLRYAYLSVLILEIVKWKY